MLKCVGFLPIAQSRAGLLCLFNSYLRRHTLTALQGVRTEPGMGFCWRGGMDEARRVLKVPVSLLGEPSGEVSPMAQGWAQSQSPGSG